MAKEEPIQLEGQVTEVLPNATFRVLLTNGHTVTNAHDTYRLRRADLKLSGAISPRVRWRLSFDAAKLLNLTKTSMGSGDSSVVRDVAVDQRGRILQEASVNVTLSPLVRLD